MEIRITYYREGFGPYQQIFYSQTEATEWIYHNEVEIVDIEMI